MKAEALVGQWDKINSKMDGAERSKKGRLGHALKYMTRKGCEEEEALLVQLMNFAVVFQLDEKGSPSNH